MPKIIDVSFPNSPYVYFELDDGRLVYLPLVWFPRLEHGTEEELSEWKLLGGGEGVHWPVLDEDISLKNILEGKQSGESKSSFQKWLDNRKDKQIKQKGSV